MESGWRFPFCLSYDAILNLQSIYASNDINTALPFLSQLETAYALRGLCDYKSSVSSWVLKILMVGLKLLT